MTAALASGVGYRACKPSADTPRELFGYEIIDFIGEGAGSTLYVAAEPLTGQLFALKHVIRRREKDSRFLDQLKNEFAVSQKFIHPNLRRSLHCKDNASMLRRASEAVLLMELFDGSPLENFSGTDAAKLVQIFMQVATGLGAVHAQGFVHCDLKPNNILVAHDGAVKIIDFGQTCPIGAVKERIQGTPDFIAPEQVRCDPVSVRTDVFNLGATMYWTLTRRTIPTLFTLARGDNSFLVDERIPSPGELEAKIPEALSNLVMECVKTNPAPRPADMTEVSRRLDVVAYAMGKRVA